MDWSRDGVAKLNYSAWAADRICQEGGIDLLHKMADPLEREGQLRRSGQVDYIDGCTPCFTGV